jgi:hypothetical protein
MCNTLPFPGFRFNQNPNCNRAASDIISFVHCGSHTSYTAALFTSGMFSIFRSTSGGSVPATGHPGAVNVILT